MRDAHGRRGLALVSQDVIRRDILMLQKLRRDHLGTSSFFYLDISYEETLRRHSTRPQRNQFSAEDMRKWYLERDVLPDGCETLIGQDSSLEETTRRIMREAGPTTHHPTSIPSA